jgi:hypothetical protein
MGQAGTLDWRGRGPLKNEGQWMAVGPIPPKPLTPGEQSLLDLAKAILQQCAIEERAYAADGWVGVRINLQQGTLKGRPRRWTEVSRP